MTNRNKLFARQQAFEVILARQEAGFSRAIGKARNRFLSQCAKAGEVTNAALEQYSNEMERLITVQTDRVVRFHAQATFNDLRQLKADPEPFFTRMVREWLALDALTNVKTIVGNTVEQVRKVITATQRAGEGSRAIGREIRKLAKLTPYQAERIARTETHGAALFGQEQTAKYAAEEFGLRLVKLWIPASDARTRDDHRVMINHPAIGLDEKFRVGGTMMSRPGDPAGGASQVINCRCSLVHREVEFIID